VRSDAAAMLMAHASQRKRAASTIPSRSFISIRPDSPQSGFIRIVHYTEPSDADGGNVE
jgi:hypothetical protein